MICNTKRVYVMSANIKSIDFKASQCQVYYRFGDTQKRFDYYDWRQTLTGCNYLLLICFLWVILIFIMPFYTIGLK